MITAEMKQAIKTLTAIGLINTTSARQLKNGTLEFSDPMEKIPARYNGEKLIGPFMVKYTLHSNGYYRKYNPYSERGIYEGYQLNRVKKIKNPINRGEYSYIVRILVPNQYEIMAARIIPIVFNSRKNSRLNTTYSR